ncbi:putative sensor domain DACNV-containing protein [Parapedobacter tibetensis]|uniref:putative sensor domain DACNV-containing protein n=1 Tax=Parapedobacter tibetensis TaxID=2972951 RepID=UPI00214D66A2|nr:hypothetical protein [Parapedobacter tibetensis]
MISEPTYLAAKMVSHTVRQHFEQQRTLLGYPSDDGVYVPDIQIIEAIIDAAFWASLRREEGYEPKISLALLPPEPTEHNLIFQRRQRFTPYNLVKLSPAVVQPGIHLGIWFEDDNLHIWGTAQDLPPLCFVLEVVEAGLLVVKQKQSDQVGKFINVAVLKGDQIKIIDETQWGMSESPDMLSALLGFPISARADRSANVLVQLAMGMRSHGRGALLLVVPQNSSAWLHSVVKPINYLIDPVFSLVPNGNGETSSHAHTEALHKAITAVGGYSAIDGATVITKDHQLLAFGAKIARSPNALPVEKIMLTEPIAGGAIQQLDATNIGGTRHLAAAQFVHDQRDSLALVASQDGTFTVFSWSENQEMVHGHRIDTLLM